MEPAKTPPQVVRSLRTAAGQRQRTASMPFTIKSLFPADQVHCKSRWPKVRVSDSVCWVSFKEKNYANYFLECFRTRTVKVTFGACSVLLLYQLKWFKVCTFYERMVVLVSLQVRHLCIFLVKITLDWSLTH